MIKKSRQRERERDRIRDNLIVRAERERERVIEGFVLLRESIEGKETHHNWQRKRERGSDDCGLVSPPNRYFPHRILIQLRARPGSARLGSAFSRARMVNVF